MKDFFRRYNPKILISDVNAYGFKYSIKDFFLSLLGILGVTFGVSYISMLQMKYIIALMVVALFASPFLVLAWFKQMYNARRFTMTTDYLSNIIPIFEATTKIRTTLEEVSSLCDGIMRDKILEAIDYIDNNTTDVNGEKTALEIIETEFPNSRIKSVHKMMLTIEAESSLTFRDVCENMSIDVDNWIRRTYLFQSDLKDRRKKLVLLCIITLLMNCLFIYLYTSNEYFLGFTDRILYQISTTVFIGALLLVMVMVITKLHGGWLVNDLTRKDEDEIAKAYDLVQEGNPGFKIVDMIFAAIFVIIGGYIYLYGLPEALGLGINAGSAIAIVIGLLFFFMAYMMLMHRKSKYNYAMKRLKKAYTIEFPMWLREVSLSLNTMTVLNAIERSMSMTSYAMTKELEIFMEEIKKNPTSIKPFNDFLDKYDLQDVKSSMRTLYSIQNLNRAETKKQVAELILRNQELLNKAETIQNQDAISEVEALGYVPILIFTVQMMISLFLLFAHMMDKLNATIYDSGVFD